MTAVSFTVEGLETDVKLLHCDESLDVDAKLLHHAESLEADVKLLHRREGLEASVRELCCMPIIPWSSPGEVPSLTMEQLLEGKAVSKDNGQNVPKCAPVARAALTLPKLPTFSIWASSIRRNSGEPQLPKAMVPDRCRSTSVINIASRLVANVNACLSTSLGTHTNVPREVVLRPGVDPPAPDEVRHMPPDEASSTTLWLKSKSAVSKEEMSTLQCLPKAKTASVLPNGCLPIISTQATPSRQAKNELKWPLPMVLG